MALTLTFIIAQQTTARAVFIPPNLPPGSQYELLFVTNGGFYPDIAPGQNTLMDISAFNDFVTQQAALNPALPSGITWHALFSTSTVDAKDNAPTSNLPIYNTAAEPVAIPGTALYQVGGGTLLNWIAFDQFGNVPQQWLIGGFILHVWTGSDETGVYDDGGSAAKITIGEATANNFSWIIGERLAPDTLPLYALSSPITVPSPEPSTLILAALGGLALLAWRRR